MTKPSNSHCIIVNSTAHISFLQHKTSPASFISTFEKATNRLKVPQVKLSGISMQNSHSVPVSYRLEFIYGTGRLLGHLSSGTCITCSSSLRLCIEKTNLPFQMLLTRPQQRIWKWGAFSCRPRSGRWRWDACFTSSKPSVFGLRLLQPQTAWFFSSCRFDNHKSSPHPSEKKEQVGCELQGSMLLCLFYTQTFKSPPSLFIWISRTAKIVYVAIRYLGDYCITTDSFILPLAWSFYSVRVYLPAKAR